MTKILVLSATGRVGRHLTGLLVAAGHKVSGVTSRHEGAAELEADGVEPIVADIRRPADLNTAFAAAEAVFLATPDLPDQDKVETALINEMAKAGRPHVVKLSAQSAGLSPPVSFGRFHRIAEEALASSGLSHAVVRPTFFQQSLLLFAGDISGKNKLIAPAGGGRIAMVDIADVAEAAAKLLADTSHAGGTYTLTGPEAVSFGDVVGKLSSLTGRTIKHVSPPIFIARIVLPFLSGMPRWLSNLVVDLLAALKAGAQADVSPELEDLIGRPRGSVEAFLKANIKAFQGGP